MQLAARAPHFAVRLSNAPLSCRGLLWFRESRSIHSSEPQLDESIADVMRGVGLQVVAVNDGAADEM